MKSKETRAKKRFDTNFRFGERSDDMKISSEGTNGLVDARF
jgi:hypothetical protein